MEVAAEVVPLDLCLCEIAIRDTAKIAAKRQDDPLKCYLNRYRDDDVWDSTETPLGKAMSQVIEMKTVTGIGIDFMEPDFAQNSFVRTTEKPSYWSQLGSSKNRTNEQQEEGKAMVQDMVNEVEVSASALVCFTDGSCLLNPGPCGAGAFIYHPDGQEECIKRPVTAYGSILLGELVAILSVIEHLIVNSSQIQHREMRIFSDSQTAVGIITLNWVSNHYLDVIKKINDNMSSLESKGWKLDSLDPTSQ